MKNDQDRREFTRVPITVEVKVSDGQTTIVSDKTQDVSLILLCQLGCPRTDRPLDWHEKVSCHAVCLPLANVEHGVADPRYK